MSQRCNTPRSLPSFALDEFELYQLPYTGGAPVRARIPIKHRPNLGTDSRRPSRTLGPPPGLSRAHAPSARDKFGLHAWLQRVQPQSVPQCRGSWSKGQGASAWRRTLIVEVSHLAPPVAGAITAASQTTETASAAHAARLRRVLAKRHALPTINRSACSARRICHQQAFAGPQHLVGWRSFDVCDGISSRPTWCVSVDTCGRPQRKQIWTGCPLTTEYYTE